MFNVQKMSQCLRRKENENQRKEEAKDSPMAQCVCVCVCVSKFSTGYKQGATTGTAEC